MVENNATFADKKCCIVNASRVDWNEDIDYTYLKKVCQVAPHFDGQGVNPTDE